LAAPLFLEAGRMPVKGAAEERLLAEETQRLMQAAGLA
jgi:ATP-dependent Lhr-like helicase